MSIRERGVEPIEPIKRTKAVYRIHPLKMEQNRRYHSNFSQILANIERTKKEPQPDQPAAGNQDQNPEGIGEHIDFRA